jgi:hypothetical protein
MADCDRLSANGKADGMDWGTRVWCGWMQKLVQNGIQFNANGDSLAPARNDPKTQQLLCWGMDWGGLNFASMIGMRRIMHLKSRGNAEVYKKIWEIMTLNPWPE